MGIVVEKENDSSDGSKILCCRSEGFICFHQIDWRPINCRLTIKNVFDNRSLCIFYHKIQRISKNLDTRLLPPISTIYVLIFLSSFIKIFKNRKIWRGKGREKSRVNDWTSMLQGVNLFFYKPKTTHSHPISSSALEDFEVRNEETQSTTMWLFVATISLAYTQHPLSFLVVVN